MCLGCVPYTAALMASYDLYRAYLFGDKSFDLLTKFTSIGLLSTLTAQVLTHPLDTVRKRLQADNSLVNELREYTGTRDCFKKTFANEGLKGFYKGFLIGAVKTPVFTLINFMVYESWLNMLTSMTLIK
jgi:phage-related holin